LTSCFIIIKEHHFVAKALGGWAIAETAVRAVLAAFDGPVGVDEAAGGFNGRRTQKRLNEVGDILEMLVALRQIEGENGKYS
jgi:hypothetical protein